MNELDEWRKKIDEIDLQLVRLLNDRAQCAQEVGRLKLLRGLDAYAPEREEEIMQNVTTHNAGPLSAEAVRRVFERILDESRTLERMFMDAQRKSTRAPKE
ncbi:MAG: chorismate mutase [Bacteroidota bacterium]